MSAKVFAQLLAYIKREERERKGPHTRFRKFQTVTGEKKE